jgi:multidrug efflux pump subunit AcrA (membrane-fusion protein)
LSAARDAGIEVPGTPRQFRAITGEGRGHWVSLGLEVDLATRTVPLIYEVANADGALRIGQSVDLFVTTGRAEATLALPAEAILEEGGRPIAFVQLGGETFAKRELTLGLRDEARVQVLAGVQEGERVVTRGAYAVKLAAMSSAIPAHGHAH